MTNIGPRIVLSNVLLQLLQSGQVMLESYFRPWLPFFSKARDNLIEHSPLFFEKFHFLKMAICIWIKIHVGIKQVEFIQN